MPLRVLIVGTTFAFAAIVGFASYVIVVDFSAAPPPHVLLIGDVNSATWERTSTGARCAANTLKLHLDIETIDGEAQLDEQLESIRRMGVAAYNGVAFHTAGSTSQLRVINALAEQAKLVTVGNDRDDSKRLCHVAFSEFENGRLVARVVRGALKSSNQPVLLIGSATELETDANGSERLQGFQMEWQVTEQLGVTSALRFLTLQRNLSKSELEQLLSAAIANPELGAVVALDSNAANCLLAAQAAGPHNRRTALFAFDPTDDILKAIEDGRVRCAVANDPFQCGYEAVRRLAIYAPKNASELPAAGHGEERIFGEAITQSNLRDVRDRLPN
jgi:ribose transport system substrate-binding protein